MSREPNLETVNQALSTINRKMQREIAVMRSALREVARLADDAGIWADKMETIALAEIATRARAAAEESA